MTERDQVGGPLRRHDAREARDGQDVALRERAGGDPGERLRPHGNLAAGDGLATGDVLGGDVDHARRARGIDVGQIHATTLRHRGKRDLHHCRATPMIEIYL